MWSIRDKVIAVTGAGSGIGRALSLKLATSGARLSISDIDEEGLSETAQRCRNLSGEVLDSHLNVADREAVFEWAEKTRNTFGKIDAVINNAGVSLSCSVEDLNPDDFNWIMAINFWGVVHGTQAFLPHLRDSGDGHIVNISSLFGLMSMPGASAYNASKFAVRGFTEALSEELRLTRAPVTVTCVHPGGIDTKIVAKGRITANSDLGFSTQEKAAQDFKRLARTSPESAAADIVKAMTQRRRRALIGLDAKMLDKVQRMMPTAYQTLVVHFSRKNNSGNIKKGQ